MEDDYKVKIGITHGDINGIGYEVIIKALVDNRIMDFCVPIVYGSPKLAAYHRKALNISNFSLVNIRNVDSANEKRPNVINCIDDNIRVELGKSTDMAGESSLQSIQAAVRDLQEGKIDALVTAPINKFNIKSSGFDFTGHTEYLGSQFNGQPLMLMVSDEMKVGVVTGHVPIAEVPKLITMENILEKLKILNQSLLQDFAIQKPRIAVLGLNPHAGDEGVIGKEEEEVIIPAVEKAREVGIMALGPYPADGFFGSSSCFKFDAILAMYHDQGLAPFKAMAFDRGVNYTAGLSAIRTSPAHGTAYELAGKGEASPESFRKALYLASDIFRNRKKYQELKENQLDVDELPPQAS